MARRRPANPYADLRARILALHPSAIGLMPTQRHPRVFGALFETGFPEGSMSLLCLSDGTTSVYLSNGGGAIGAGRHERVALAAWAFLDAVEAALDLFGPDEDGSVPPPGWVAIRALTFDGRVRLDGEERDVAESLVYLAAHDVITEIGVAERMSAQP